MLNAYRALELTDQGGLLCGRILADLGADIIAVEPPGGSPARRIGPFAGDVPDPERSLFWWAYSRNKRGVTLNLEAEEGREQLRGLVRDADFLVESFAPGYLDRLGVGYAALNAVNPRLVMVSITPFGQQGPKAHWAATDLTALAASGVLLVTGDDDRPPVRTTAPRACLHAGAEAAVGALIAHRARERDGIGQYVDVSAQTAAMMATQSFILAEGWSERALTRIAGGAKAGRHKLKWVYPCEDGYVSVTFLFDRTVGPYTRRLFEWMCEEEFVDAATRDKDWIGFWDRLAARAEPPEELTRCTEAIERFMLSHGKAELFAGAQHRGLLVVPVSTTADLVNSEQYRSRDWWQPADLTPSPFPGRQGETSAATALYAGPFAKFSAAPLQHRRRAPLVGEHNKEVFAATRRRARPRKAEGAPAGRAAARNQRRSMAGLEEGAFGPDLAGITILEMMWVFAGPMGTRYFADRGATVVRSASALRPDTLRASGPCNDKRLGAERSANYANANVNKYSLSLSLTCPEARKLVLRLVAWADVVTEGFSQRAMRAWGSTARRCARSTSGSFDAQPEVVSRSPARAASAAP